MPSYTSFGLVQFCESHLWLLSDHVKKPDWNKSKHLGCTWFTIVTFKVMSDLAVYFTHTNISFCERTLVFISKFPTEEIMDHSSSWYLPLAPVACSRGSFLV